MILFRKHNIILSFVIIIIQPVILSACKFIKPSINPQYLQSTEYNKIYPSANYETRSCLSRTINGNKFPPIEGKNKIAFSSNHLSFYDVDANKIASVDDLVFPENSSTWGFVWGPYSEEIVFINGNSQPFPSNKGCLYLANLKSGTLTLLDGMQRIYKGIDWSPDGNTIAFLEENGTVGLISLKTKDINIVYQNTQIDQQAGFYWKDENTLLFAIIDADEYHKELMQYSIKNASSESIYRGAIQRFAYNHANKMLIIYSGMNYIFDSNLHIIKEVNNGPDDQLQWSPAGASIIGKKGLSQIILLDAERGYAIEPIDIMGTLGRLSWSPDGQQIAILSTEDVNGYHDLIIMNLNIKQEVQRMTIPITRPFDFAWSNN